MKNIFRFSALLAICSLFSLTGCTGELSTDQFDDDAVVFSAFAPNPLVRGAELRIMGSNLDKIAQVQIPGADPITEIEVISTGRISEIRVVTPANGAEDASITGPVVIIDKSGNTYKSKTDIEFTEGIVLESFSPANAMPGDEITVKGDYLYNVQQVVLKNGVYVTADQITYKSRRELKFIVPSAAVTGPVTIGDVDEHNNPDGLIPNNIPSEGTLTIGDPTVKSADRGMLKAGAEITVQGEYLDMIAKAAIGGVEVDFTLAEDHKSVKVVLPATVVEGEIVLTSFAGKEFNAGAYTTVVPTGLAIAAETRYKAGLSAVVTGKDLDLVTKADLAGTALEYTYAEKKIAFTIPATAVDGVVTLTLANGKTVETEAIELVKPVVSSISPLELYAGDESVVVTGEDLDLVVSATLGGKAEEIEAAEDGSSVKVATTVSSVSGKVTLALANGIVIEPAEEVKVNYHALVIVNEMPSAEHIGAKVTLTGSNFMLVENIFIGEEKVKSYFSRTDEEVSFVMPWNKVGTYNIYFDLLNGDREMLATPIEVLLEIKYITGWEGNTEITWSDGGRVYVPAAKFEGVKAGAKMRLYYTQKDQVWAQAQINYGDWTGLTFPEIGSNTLVPTEIYGWFADGILDRCTEVTLTKEILDNIQAKKGDSENQKNVGIIIQGSDLIFTKIEILQEISQEVTLWEGELIADDWGNQPNVLSDAGVELAAAGAQPGQIVYFYFEQIGADPWKVEIVEGHWGPTYKSICAVGSDTEGGKFTEYDLDANGGKFGLTLTQEILDAAFTQQWWGGTFILNGDNTKCTKVTLL